MKYLLYTLSFLTPVHFGMTSLGGGLEKAEMTIPSDTFFSALAAGLGVAGEADDLERLLSRAAAGEILFSSLLPWHEFGEDMAYYVPRPVRMPSARHQAESYRKTCVQATQRKKLKKMNYLRAGRLHDSLAAMEKGAPLASEEPEFGRPYLVERVNCRGEEPLPYYVGAFSFARGAGLYLLVGLVHEEDAIWLEELLAWLGMQGIGGKRTSGYGKFELFDDALELGEDSFYPGGDDVALYTMLRDDKAPLQLALSSLLPEKQDIPQVKAGGYRLRRAGGFFSFAQQAAKKRGVTLLEAGSCLKERIRGRVAELDTLDGHAVYRYGLGLYAGVRL